MRRLLFASVLLLPLVALFATPADAATGDLIKTWPTPAGQAPGKLGFIYGLALDADGNVWVADTSNDRIQRFSGSGKFQKVIDGNLDGPEGVTVGPTNGWIYVTDSLHDKIKVFGKGGELKFKFGKPGETRRRLDFPTSVAIAASDGDIIVADNHNDKVQKYRPDGRFDDSFDDLGLVEPSGVAVDPATDLIYIADSGNDRIVVVNHEGVFQDEWSTDDRPSMLTVGEGNVYVTNGFAGNVQKFQTDGVFVDEWSGPTGMESPCGIALTPNGKVYVAEFGNRRVQKFEG